MPRIPDEQLARLRRAIQEHEFLQRILRRVEQLHRVVFHEEQPDGQLVRNSAEDILIADIMVRHQGDIDGVHEALHKIQNTGQTSSQALLDYAAYIHNYYTMPLGVVMRKDLFGNEAHFAASAAGSGPVSRRTAAPG